MIKDYLSLSIENLKHRGVRSWLTMLGIFIGIAAVVALISLGQGLQNAVTGQFSSLSADTLVVQNTQTGFGPPGSTSVKKLTQHDLNIIESVSGIADIIPRLLRMVKVEYNKKTVFKYVASLPPEQNRIDAVYTAADLRIDQGRLLRAGDSRKVVLGHDFTDNTFKKSIKVGSHINIQGEDFEVVGILKVASTFTINGAILMPEKDLKRIANIGDEIDFVAVRVQDKNQLENIAKQIEEKMRKDRNEKSDEEDFTIQTPAQALSTVNTILTIINIIVTGIAAISLLVGGIGIANTMYTSVLERTKEIGTMKAIGAQNKNILTIFLVESSLLGLVGGMIGAVIGLSLAFGVSAIAAKLFGSNILAITISWPLLTMAILFSLLIGVLSGLLPSLQASKLKPVEALRR